MRAGEKSAPAGRRSKSPTRKQRGAALLIFTIIVVMGALAYLLSGFEPDFTEASRERKTHEALVQAREALIGYALTYRDREPDRMFGYLPMPDLGKRGTTTDPKCKDAVGKPLEGCPSPSPSDVSKVDGNYLPTLVGRFPWRLLGTQPLRDGHGECLWIIVSSLAHAGNASETVFPFNWDTLSYLDVRVANNSNALQQAITNPHDRPWVVIYAPGPPLAGQDRGKKANDDDVTECGGNYDARNYLDPYTNDALGGPKNYLANINNASDSSDYASRLADPLKITAERKIFQSGSNFLPIACSGNDCTLLANDTSLTVTGDQIFTAARNLRGDFRESINSMLDRMVDCLRDLGVPGGHDKILDNACYGGSNVVPLGYYPHYKDMTYVAGGSPNVNGNNSCAGALLFGNQRNPAQLRDTAMNRGISTSYLEPPNHALGPSYSGQELFERISGTQTASQDIVRCIPSTSSFVTTQSPGLALAGFPQLANYSALSRTLTLGQPVVGSALDASVSNFLYGCAWRPETHTLGGGLRSYFTFRINDVGGASWPTLGFTFAMIDGDNNGIDACGAAAQHLGYSGNNTESPFIAQPKIAFEIDPRREAGFNPALSDHLLNGRNDPPSGTYRGGHVAISYWGGETAFSAMPFAAPPPPTCSPPAFDPGFGANCYLPQEEDDNVHAQPAIARAGFPAPPANPAIPALELSVPPNSPAGAYKLDPTLTSTPVNQDFHVRVELTRTGYVRVASAANLNLSAPGNPVNGVTLTTGDRVWVRYQTVSSENGLYVWNGAATPMTRLADGESSSSFSLPRVRVATTGNIDIFLPGDTIDSVFLFAGDRVLVKNQATAAQNGVYVWSAPNLPMTRAADADSAAELAGMVVEVRQGALNAGSIWRQNSTNIVVDTTALGWNNIRVKLAAPATTILASPGAELDGIKMKAGDRVFIRTMGIYIWNGAATPMTPAPAPDNSAGSIVQILQGSEASAWWRFDGAAWQRLSVRVASQSNLTLAAPGANIDGITMAAGDRVLVKSQASAAENGIYIWNGAAVPMTRSADAATPAQLSGALTQVLEGSDVARAFRQTSLAASGTIDSSPVQWAALDRSTSYLLEIWILLDSPSYTAMIAAMKDTTRSMSLLYPGFTPHLQDRPVIPYSFRNARLGYTIGQRTSINDQMVLISNSFTTWLE